MTLLECAWLHCSACFCFDVSYWIQFSTKQDIGSGDFAELKLFSKSSLMPLSGLCLSCFTCLRGFRLSGKFGMQVRSGCSFRTCSKGMGLGLHAKYKISTCSVQKLVAPSLFLLESCWPYIFLAREHEVQASSIALPPIYQLWTPLSLRAADG